MGEMSGQMAVPAGCSTPRTYSGKTPNPPWEAQGGVFKGRRELALIGKRIQRMSRPVRLLTAGTGDVLGLPEAPSEVILQSLSRQAESGGSESGRGAPRPLSGD